MSNMNVLPMSEVAVRLHEIATRDTATKVTVSADDLRQLLSELSQAGAQRDETVHQMQQLGQTLGECIVAAGITNPAFALSGPELLPLESGISVKIGRALIDGRVIRHPKNRTGHLTITNIKTGKDRNVYHTQVVEQQ